MGKIFGGQSASVAQGMRSTLSNKKNKFFNEMRYNIVYKIN